MVKIVGFDVKLPRGTKLFWHRFRQDKKAVLGLGIIIIAIFIGVFAPRLSPYNPYKMSNRRFLPPSREYPLGTDNLGRDVLSRMIWGTRVSLTFGVGVGMLSLILGIFLGAIPGYYGGWVDNLFSRFFEFFMLLPELFLIILLVSIFGNNIFNTMFVVAITLWPSNARITRAQTLSLKNRTFVQAAKAAGASDFRILFTHILPNGVYPVIVYSTLQMGRAIITEAGLSFLGLGDINFVSWGQTLFVAQKQIFTWWLALFPGMAIAIIVLAFNFVGGGLNYALNPRLREIFIEV